MRIDDFGVNADGTRWTVRGEHLTWGNSELEIGEHLINHILLPELQ